jgi:hypothetical protein
MDELQKLYGVLVREGKYTKSFDEFKSKWSSDTDYQNQVFDVVSRDGLYTKDKQSFFQKYSGAAPVFQEQVSVQPQVKKKEPTMASKSDATSSESQRPSPQYGQQFTEPLTEFKQEPTAPPIVLTEEGKKTYVAPKPKPFDIELATKSLQKMNEDRASEYRKDPSIVVREEKEKAIQQANDGILTREESLRNITSNAVNTIKMVVPKMNLVADQALEKLFGRELSSKLVGTNIYTGATMDEERTKALGEIGDLMSQMKETTGITESVKKLSRGENGSASDLIVAAANSLSQIGTTAINAFATRGLSLYTDAVGGALYDYNEEKAKQKGKTIEQLFQDEEADVAVPALFGGVSFYLDKIGLQGATNMIKKKLTGDFMKKAALFGFETNKEGMTEWFQEGVDAANTTIGKGGSAKDATQAAVDAMFSERGLETYLQGSVGSAALVGGARLISKDNHNDYSKLTEENVKLLGDLKNGNIDTDTKKMVLDVLADNKSKLDDILSFDRKVIDKLSEEDKAKVADLYVELNAKRKLKNNGNISEVLRTKVIEDVDKLETEISNIVNKVLPEQEVKKPFIKPALTLVETIRRDELQTAIDEQKNTTGIIVIGDESMTKEEAVNELQLLNKKEQDAIQEQTTDEGVLRTEQPQVGLQEVGEGDQATEVVTEEAKPKEEVVTQVNVAPYFNTKIETIEDAEKLRSNKDYQQHKKNLIALANDLGIPDAQVEDVIGGYKNNAGEDFVEISNVVSLGNATIDQAEKFAALAAVTSPEVQEATIAAQYIEEGSDVHNANEYTIKVSDVNGAMKSLKESGISDFTVNEKNGTVSFIDVFEFEDDGFEERISKFVDSLDNKGITYEEKQYRPVESRYVDKGKRKEILTGIKSTGTDLRQGGENLYTKIDQAIARDAEFNGVPIEEYLGVLKTAEQEVSDLESLLRENRLSAAPYNEKYKKNAAQIENQRRLAELARKSLAKIAPNVKIILHETAEDYDKAVPQRSQGAFISKTNTIHINLEYADVETIPHEVFHAILFIKIKTDPRTTKVTKEMFESVKKVLDKNSPVYKQIEEIASNYKESLKDEERLAELFGILSVNYEQLPVPAKNAIVRFIEKIAKLFGLDATKLIGRTDNNVINLLNTLSEKVAKGEEIQESEIDIIGIGGDGTRPTLFRQADANNINNIIKLGRANGFSEQAISTVLKNRGFSKKEITNALATELGAKGTVEVTEELLPGKEELLKKVDALIKRQQSKNVTKEKIAENVKKLMEKSDAYNNATDIQKEKLIRDANKKIGIREKSAPSVKALKQGIQPETKENGLKKYFASIEPEKKITMTEKQALVEQIKNEARGAKDAKKAWMSISKELTKSIKELRTKGKITVNQAASALRKFSSVNVFDEASIDRFVQYMSKVFENAEYAEKISNAFAKLPTAKKNAKTKLGIAESLTPALNRMLSIKPTLIPDAVLDSYLDIVDMIGKKAEVLSLEEVNSLTKRVNDILDAVDTEVSKADELAERFNEYDGKVIDEDGKLDYAATIKAMLKDNTISEDEAEIMRKYKSSIVEPVERVKKTEEELAAEKEELISAVESLDVDTETLPTRDERDLAKELASLIKTDAIKELSNNQLKNLFKTIDNINNGYLPHYAQLMVEKLNAINNAKQLTSGIQKAALLPFSKLYANLKSLITRKGAVLEMIRRNPLANLDQVFGNFKDKTIFNSLFEKSAEAETKYKSEVTRVQQKLSDAQESVAKSFNNDANKTLMSSFKMMTYMIQLEHDSNIGNKQVNQAADYLKATIKHIDEGKSEFGERDANMLQDIVDKYTNEESQIDIDKLYNSFNDAEKNAINTVREINESLTDKAVYTASIIRGDKINPLNNYVHLNVLNENLPQDNIAGASSMEQYNQSMMPSSKAKSLIERTGKVSPLNFDIFTSALRGANFVLMDYNLTQPIRTARKTINETTAMLEKDGRMSNKDRELLNAVKDAYEEVVSNVLTNNFINTSIADDVMDFMTRQGYRAVLASAPRFVSELSSNISYALIAEPKAFQKGIELRGVAMSPNSVDIMNNVDSKQTTRIFHGDTLSGRLVDTSTLNQVSGVKGGKGKSDVANKTQQIYNNSLKKYKNFVELTADALISTPDKMVMRPIWFGAFANEFENVSGKKPDFDKIAANDEAYMSENKEAIDKARNSADDKTVRAGATENAFMGILKGTVKPTQSALLRGFNTFNNFMTKFMIYEYVTARAGINAAMGNGSVSRKQGVALIAGVTSRMLVYSIMTQMLGSAMVGLITGDDDEEDDKTFLQKIGQYMASTATGLILGRDYGNATKSMINFGVEKMNEKYLDFLREGEYDPYQDAIQYTMLPTDSKKSQTDLGDLLMKVGGALGPSMKTADLIIKKATGEPKQEAEAIERSDREIKQRIPLEVLGNTGFIPLYKDVRKILMSDMYKELRQSKGPTKKDAEQELLQGYDTREDMKRYDPTLYEQTFGKGSPTYQVDKMIKDMEKQEKDMEQKIKDMTYGYTGETKNKTKKKK